MRTSSDMEEMETRALLFNLYLWNRIIKSLVFSGLTGKNIFSDTSCPSLQIFLRCVGVDLMAWGIPFFFLWYFRLGPDIPCTLPYPMFQVCGLWAIWQPTQRASLLEVKFWKDWKEKIQKQNWQHREKNRSSQARLFRRGTNCGLVEELLEWRKVRQCAYE